jgi:lysophospholipase L1-like esterase
MWGWTAGVPVVLVKPEVGVYRVSGLGKGIHAVRVMVATESQDGPNTFGGFGIAKGEKALVPERRKRQMEFIGDSHTVGYGNTSPKGTCSTDEVWATTDDTQAFGAMTARHYGADYQVNAISGRGVVRNYNGFAADKLPEAYPYVLFDKKQMYADAGWRPQVIVVALGTNDFSTALNAGEQWKTRDELHADYEKTYVRFLQELRKRNPGAYFVLWGTDKAKGEIEAEERRVVDAVKAMGERRIAFVAVDPLEFTGVPWTSFGGG